MHQTACSAAILGTAFLFTTLGFFFFFFWNGTDLCKWKTLIEVQLNAFLTVPPTSQRPGKLFTQAISLVVRGQKHLRHRLGGLLRFGCRKARVTLYRPETGGDKALREKSHCLSVKDLVRQQGQTPGATSQEEKERRQSLGGTSRRDLESQIKDALVSRDDNCFLPSGPL